MAQPVRIDANGSGTICAAMAKTYHRPLPGACATTAALLACARLSGAGVAHTGRAGPGRVTTRDRHSMIRLSARIARCSSVPPAGPLHGGLTCDLCAMLTAGAFAQALPSLGTCQSPDTLVAVRHASGAARYLKAAGCTATLPPRPGLARTQTIAPNLATLRAHSTALLQPGPAPVQSAPS